MLSDDVGQIYLLNTGQGESQKDAKYDQVLYYRAWSLRMLSNKNLHACIMVIASAVLTVLLGRLSPSYPRCSGKCS